MKANNGNQPTVWNIGIPLFILCMLLASAFFIQNRIANAFPKTETEFTTELPSTPTTEMEEEVTTTTEITPGVEADDNYLYIFCEVTETNPETFVVKLPNGNLETFYMIQDPPIDDNGNPWFSVVVFRVEKGNEDNLDEWKVLTVD